MSKRTVVTVTGIRPDFIRMSEIFRKLDEDEAFEHILVHTGQHYDDLLSGVFFKDLNIRKPDYNLSIGGKGRSHHHQQAELSVRVLELFDQRNINPDIVLFLGDSNSVLASVPVRKQGFKVGHIEAGMRSYDERMLEEINRKVCDHVSNFLFVYHDNYKQKALKEGIPEERIYVVGNTIVEPLRKMADLDHAGTREHILLDIHRPENFLYPERLKTIIEYTNRYSEIFSTPVKMLSFGRTEEALKKYNVDLGKIQTVPLMGYKDYIRAQQNSRFIISDSGTAQEEPALLGVPVIVPREFTERPESIENDCSFMLKFNENSFVDSIDWLLSETKAYTGWLGKGNASQAIVDILKKEL